MCSSDLALAVPLNPLAYASLGTLNLGTGQYTLLTDGAAPTLVDGSNQLLATGWYVAQADAFNPLVAVFSFDSIQVSLGATITAVGANPLALLSRGDITIAGDLDAAGRKGGQQGNGFGGRGGPGGGAGGAGGGSVCSVVGRLTCGNEKPRIASRDAGARVLAVLMGLAALCGACRGMGRGRGSLRLRTVWRSRFPVRCQAVWRRRVRRPHG